MPQTKIQGKFYPLKSEEWLDSINQLTHSELKILYYVRSLDPYNNGIDITPAQIARDLSTEKNKMHRSTVGRALKSLDKKGFINMELIKVRIKVNPRGFLAEPEPKPEPKPEPNPEAKNDVVATQPCCDHATNVVTTQHRVQPRNTECAHTTQSAATQQSKAETQSEQKLENPKTLKTYLDFKRSLSEGERENFFNFVKEKTNNLEKPINDLEAWLASKNAAKQNRWEIYYKNYQEEKIGQSAKANKHNQDLASSTLAQQKQALNKFHERLKRNSNSNEPEDNNSEEYQQSLAELNQLLNNPPEFGSSLFKKKAAEEAAKRQARLEQLEQETLLLMADPERLDSLLEEDQRLRRQIDARNSKDESEDLSVLQETDPELYRALNPERNPEINPEDLENE